MTGDFSDAEGRYRLLLAVAAGLVLVGLTQLLGAGVVLILAGIVTLLIGVIRQKQFGNDGLAAIITRLATTDPVVLCGYTGVALIVLGVLIRFSPSDVGTFLASVGLAALAIVGLHLLLRGGISHERRLPSHSRIPLTGDSADTSMSRLSDDFRHQISNAVFSHAQRASLLTFGVAITFFAVGIGTFVFLAYAIYLQITPSEQASELNRLVQSYVAFLAQNTGGLQIQQLLTVLALELSRVVPILGLIVIGWIGSRLIVNATRLSQRKVLQDTLSELGPLQSTLAGLPPRKPIAEAVEQSLKQAKRSFAVRTWLSVVLFGVGIALFISLFIYAWQTNFSANPFVTATVAGSGVVSFVLSMVANRQSEVRDTLNQIAQLQLEIADKAQRSEILDLYVAHLVKEGFNGDRLDTLRLALDWLGPLRSTKSNGLDATSVVPAAHVENGVGGSMRPSNEL